jgi:ribonucleoside-diphosphate reductase alpha chain
VFVVSGDISAEEHVRMQAALQAFVDNSLSKTVNFSAGATEDDVATAYRLAWELGCKGITVYVTGSRDKVVLETHATAKEKEPVKEPVMEKPVEQFTMWHDTKKPRPRALKGYTFQVSTPLGKVYLTVNENGGSQPFEVFITSAKAGSETAAVSEAIGRLVSYVLRMASPVEPRRRLEEVFRQLSGIGGERSMGFGPNRVRSLPDGVGQAVGMYLDETHDEHVSDHVLANGKSKHSESESVMMMQTGQPTLPLIDKGQIVGDLCPDCGQAAVINEEGCRKCYSCGYSEC